MIPERPQNRRPARRKPAARGLVRGLAQRAQPQPQQPGAAGAAAPGGGQQPGGAGAVDPYNYSADPILQRIQALGQQAVGDAEAEALRLRKQLAIDYGDDAYGATIDEGTAAAARANPHSHRAKLAKAKKEKPKALDEALNTDNLYYSGHRLKKQSELGSALLEDETNMNSAFRGALGGIEGGLMGARSAAADRDLEAQEDAAGRRRDQLGDLDYGGGGGGRGGNGLSGLVGGLIRPRPQARPRAASRPRPARAIYQ